jgi:uncharacterized protein YecT (DUF1311 family)
LTAAIPPFPLNGSWRVGLIPVLDPKWSLIVIERNGLHVFLLIALAVPFSALAKNCEDDASNMSQVRACLYKQQSLVVEAALSRLESLQHKNPTAVALLLKSQSSWQQFAEDSCDYYMHLNPKGEIPNDARANCMADFSKARVGVLNSWAQSLVQHH